MHRAVDASNLSPNPSPEQGVEKLRGAKGIGLSTKCAGGFMLGVGSGGRELVGLVAMNSWCRTQFSDAGEVVGGGDQLRGEFGEHAAAVPGLAEVCDGLEPARGLFDSFARPLAGAVAHGVQQRWIERGAPL